MGRKLALFIGNSQYQDPRLSQLITPAEDVNDLAEVLRAPDIGGFDEVKTLVNDSDANVRLSLEDFFADKKPDDLLVVYFSGHGVRDEQGMLYLAVNDTRANRLRATAIPAAFITAEMDRTRSRRQVLILDCCHSGAFAQGSKAMTGESAGTGPAFEGTGYGRVVLTATDATQYAWEGDQVIGQADNSVFTHYMVEGLHTGAADADRDGMITLDELYDYVYEKVVTATPNQTPGKWAYKEQGDIVIARNPRLTAAAPPLASSPGVEPMPPLIRMAPKWLWSAAVAGIVVVLLMILISTTSPSTTENAPTSTATTTPLSVAASIVPTAPPTSLPAATLVAAPSQTASAPLSSIRTWWNALVDETFETTDSGLATGRINEAGNAASTLQIAGGKYRWETQARRNYATIANAVRVTNGDFYAAVDMQQLGGTAVCGYGFLLRDGPAGSYTFRLTNGDQQFSVYSWNEVKQAPRALIEPQFSAAIRPGAINRLAVLAEGPRYQFFINGQPAGEISDIEWTGGTLKLFAQLCQDGDTAIVEFDNLELREP
jgi:hypothetical protein